MSLCEVLHVKILRKLLLRYKSFLKFLHAYVNNWVILWKLKMPEFMNSSFNQLLFAPKVTGFPGNLGQYTSSRLIDLRQSLYTLTFVCLKKEGLFTCNGWTIEPIFLRYQIRRWWNPPKSSQITFKSNHCLRVMPKGPKVAPLSLQAQLWIMTMNNNEWMSYNSFQFFDGFETLKRTAGVI